VLWREVVVRAGKVGSQASAAPYKTVRACMRVRGKPCVCGSVAGVDVLLVVSVNRPVRW